MHRRQLLLASSTTLLLAGCTADDADLDPPATDHNGTDDEQVTDQGEPATDATNSTDATANDQEVATLDDDHEPVDVDEHRVDTFTDEAQGLMGAVFPTFWRSDGLTVRIGVESEPSEDSPLTLAVTVTNASSFPTHIGIRDVPFFGRPGTLPHGGYADRGRDAPDEVADLRLDPTSATDFIDHDRGILREDDGAWRRSPVGRRVSFPDHVRLEPDQTMYGVFVVVADEEGAAFVPGHYGRIVEPSNFRITVWPAPHPGPVADRRLADASVPPLPALPGGSEEPSWYHEADRDTTTYLHPSAEALSTPAKLQARFVNHDSAVASGNPFGWSVWKLVEEEWYRIAPASAPTPLTYVQPGTTYDWTFRLFGGAGFDDGSAGLETSDDLTRDLGNLGSGTYAVAANMALDDEPPAAALFELEAPDQEVTPTSESRIVDEGDGYVRVRDEGWDRVSDDHRTAVGAIEADEDPAEADHRYIVEQVLRPRNHGLRNAIAYLEDAPETRLETDTSTARRMLGGESERLLAVADETFRLRTIDSD